MRAGSAVAGGNRGWTHRASGGPPAPSGSPRTSPDWERMCAMRTPILALGVIALMAPVGLFAQDLTRGPAGQPEKAATVRMIAFSLDRRPEGDPLKPTEIADPDALARAIPDEPIRQS